MLYIILPFCVCLSRSLSLCVTILTLVYWRGTEADVSLVRDLRSPPIRPTPLVSPQLRSMADMAQTCYLLVQ